MIKLFYDARQSVSGNTSFSPSAGKPEHVVASWSELAGVEIQVQSFEPLTTEDLCRAHDRRHVEAVLAGRQANGFGNRLPAVAASLPWTTGSLYAAACSALVSGTVAVSPTSGFHHAGYNYCAGFCTFNGLLIAALKLQAQLSAGRIGILDCDAHYGDGTDDIINRLGLEALFRHYTFGGRGAGVRGNGRSEDQWLHYLQDEVLPGFADCDLVLYQAGADPHVDDPLGGDLSTETMRRRDRIVFESLHAARVPVAWNLAGGYQAPLRKVLDLHDNTMRECAWVYNNAIRNA